MLLEKQVSVREAVTYFTALFHSPSDHYLKKIYFSLAHNGHNILQSKWRARGFKNPCVFLKSLAVNFFEHIMGLIKCLKKFGWQIIFTSKWVCHVIKRLYKSRGYHGDKTLILLNIQQVALQATTTTISS